MGSYCSIRTVTVPPPAKLGNIPTPITSLLPAEKHFHTHAKGVENRPVKITLLKSAHFTFLIRNTHQALSHWIIAYKCDAEYQKAPNPSEAVVCLAAQVLNKVGNECSRAVNGKLILPPTNCLDWFVYRPRGGTPGNNGLVCLLLAYISKSVFFNVSFRVNLSCYGRSVKLSVWACSNNNTQHSLKCGTFLGLY